MSGLPRELIRWIQSLDLTWSVKNPKWDLSNGYLVAEIFSWYFPSDIEMHMYYNATALDQKLCNWRLLRKVMKKQNLNISDEVVEATIHCKEGAAKVLIQMLYELLTNRQLRVMPEEADVNFSDQAYQSQLPLHARSTAINAIRNNFRISEQMVSHDLLVNQQKVQVILDRHVENRAKERDEDPERFDRKKTLGELASRRPPPTEGSQEEYDEDAGVDDTRNNKNGTRTDGNGRTSTDLKYVASADGNQNASANSLSDSRVYKNIQTGSNESVASHQSRHSTANCFQEVQVKQSSHVDYNNSSQIESNQPCCY